MEQIRRSSQGYDGPHWIPAQAFVPLAEDEVQVWRVRAVGTGPFYDACLGLLSPNELERFNRLRTCLARDEFVIARGCLRALLGAALEQNPAAIALSAGKYGKPFVAGIEFNVSHSRGLILLAMSRSIQIGIDVEWMDPGIEAVEIAQDTFAPAEIAHITAAEGEERVRAFYRCWVRKEAVAKAHGQGITLSLKDFQVDLTSGHEASVTVTPESAIGRNFYVRSIPVEGSYAGALALTNPGCPVRLFEVSPMMIIGQ